MRFKVRERDGDDATAIAIGRIAEKTGARRGATRVLRRRVGC